MEILFFVDRWLLLYLDMTWDQMQFNLNGSSAKLLVDSKVFVQCRVNLCSIKLSAGVSHVDLDIMSALLHFTIYLIQLRARARAWVPQQGVPIFTNTEWLVTDGWWETWSVVSVHLLEVDHPLAPYLRRPMWQYIIFVIFEISLTQMQFNLNGPSKVYQTFGR